MRRSIARTCTVAALLVVFAGCASATGTPDEVSAKTSAALGEAALVSVHGTASGFLIAPHPERLAEIGLPPNVASFEFYYTYETSSSSSPNGSFKLVSKDSNGAVVSVIDLKTAPVHVAVNDDSGSGPIEKPADEYVARTYSSINGVPIALGVNLLDRDARTELPASVGTYLNHLWPENYLGLGVGLMEGGAGYDMGFVANVTAISATVTPIVTDGDGDGIVDTKDLCTGSSAGAVDANGCTVAQLVPCAGPKGGGTWSNHGDYVAELTKIANAFLAAGLITQAEKEAMIAAGASASCGK